MNLGRPEGANGAATTAVAPFLADFWRMDEAAREKALLEAIAAAHSYHFERNTAYRATVATRGIGPIAGPGDMPRLLRTTSEAFKSYIDVLGTPFPEDRPADFVEWLAGQVSVDLRPHRPRLRSGYRSLEGLLSAVERAYTDMGLQMLTSRGTSGRATIIPRDHRSTDLTMESLSLSFQRYFGMEPTFTAIFMMPRRSRIAVTRMAGLSVQRVGLDGGRVHFTSPFAAYHDRVRIRSGRTYRPGLRGVMERRAWRPLMTTLQTRFVDVHAVEDAISRLIPAAAHDEKVLLFGSLDRLHRLASFLIDGGRTMMLAPGSLLGTGEGFNEASASPAEKMREDLAQAFRLTSGEAVPLRDMYGMAEANWAAIQCSHGNYHIPPWVFAVTVDDQEHFQNGPRSTGLLAFFDPLGGGHLFPPFFRTADQVTLVRGSICPCGEPGRYLERDSIRRIDLVGEAGCAGRL